MYLLYDHVVGVVVVGEPSFISTGSLGSRAIYRLNKAVGTKGLG